ncbi:hypothetical protein FJP86_18440 [Bacillus velezensis]|uniref:hypothetical protein n=1 Tax=Bacillus TaxID=1386 RepID=UPI0005DCAD72|nr:MULTISPECIES: hypothetical protein [Bacillus]COD04993.1 Uncharacterised protein [Streptococcus pneumoniae]MDK4202930.1 hypothetical protein [Bacillus velezensis]NOL16480.1 hypothetical protein [Bacillus velezensis]PWK03741.1 hypothetical protein C7819_102400 [Bacillus sp. VMFN-A1]TRW37484.1 hypothetical protein FND48_06970 [Bacillus sp. PW192]
MFIKYDELELLELFLNEPVSIADNPDAGELIYSVKDTKGFKLVLFVDVYKMECDVSLTYDESIVFHSKLNNVTQLKKVNNNMIICIKDEERIKVAFKEQFGIFLL